MKKCRRKGSVGVSRDCPNILGTHCYLRNGKSCRFQICSVYSEGPSEQKPIKKFGEKGVWAYPGTAHFFGYPVLSQEREKLVISDLASVFREGPSEQKPIKNFREKGAWAYPWTAQFFRIPPIISGTGKATFQILHVHL